MSVFTVCASRGELGPIRDSDTEEAAKEKKEKDKRDGLKSPVKDISHRLKRTDGQHQQRHSHSATLTSIVGRLGGKKV